MTAHTSTRQTDNGHRVRVFPLSLMSVIIPVIEMHNLTKDSLLGLG